MEKIIINTDGGSRGNPGPGASAYLIFNQEGKLIDQDGLFLGITTNNVAEYTAVKIALESLKKQILEVHLNVEVRSDSRLIVEQLSGRFKIKDEKLKKIHSEIKLLEIGIRKISYIYVPRASNIQADLLVNKILDDNY